MMTTKITKTARLKSYLTIPVTALLFFAFVEKVPAKTEIKRIKQNKISNLNISERENSKLRLVKQDTIKTKRKFLKKDTLTPPPPPPPYPHPKSKIKNSKQIPPPPPVDKIESQTQAEFPGGINALRQKFAENFDTSKMGNSKGMMKGIINIVVSDDGKNYNTYFEFDNDNFKKVSKEAIEKTLNNVTWKPGTQNGRPVSSMLKLPITMNFE